MMIDANKYIDARNGGSDARFINHSCEPNCIAEKWNVNNEDRIGIFTIKNVNAGDELTFDYKFINSGSRTQKCYCGTLSCKGSIGTKGKAKYVPVKMQRKKLSEEDKIRNAKPDFYDWALDEDKITACIDNFRLYISPLVSSFNAFIYVLDQGPHPVVWNIEFPEFPDIMYLFVSMVLSNQDEDGHVCLFEVIPNFESSIWTMNHYDPNPEVDDENKPCRPHINDIAHDFRRKLLDELNTFYVKEKPKDFSYNRILVPTVKDGCNLIAISTFMGLINKEKQPNPSSPCYVYRTITNYIHVYNLVNDTKAT